MAMPPFHARAKINGPLTVHLPTVLTCLDSLLGFFPPHRHLYTRHQELSAAEVTVVSRVTGWMLQGGYHGDPTTISSEKNKRDDYPSGVSFHILSLRNPLPQAKRVSSQPSTEHACLNEAIPGLFQFTLSNHFYLKASLVSNLVISHHCWEQAGC